MEYPTVTISQDRYEQLQDTETRVNVVVEMLMNDSILLGEDILLYLGFEKAAKEYKERQEEKLRKGHRCNASIN